MEANVAVENVESTNVEQSVKIIYDGDKELANVPLRFVNESKVLSQMISDFTPEALQTEGIPLVDESAVRHSVEFTFKEWLPAYFELKEKHGVDELTDEQLDELRVKFFGNVTGEVNEEFFSEAEKEKDKAHQKIIMLANYLDIKHLLEMSCKQVAEVIKKAGTTENMRRRFDIVNDFTPEEEEQIRKENAWAEED